MADFLGLAGDLLEQTGESLFKKFLGSVRIPRPVAYSFRVDIEGIPGAGFQEAKGLSDRLTPYRIDEVNSMTDSKLNVKRQPGNITLKQGLSFGGALEHWYQNTSNPMRGGPDPRKEVSIIQLYPVPKGIPLLGGKMVEMRRWVLSQCDIVDLTFPEFDAMAGDALSILSCVLSPADILGVSDAGSFGNLLDTIQQWTG